MANWFYYGADGERRGPVDGATLKQLAMHGVVRPETVLETETGQRGAASTLQGLEFGTINTPPPPPAGSMTGTQPPTLQPEPPRADAENGQAVSNGRQAVNTDSDSDDSGQEAYQPAPPRISFLMILSWMWWGVAFLLLAASFGLADKFHRDWEIPYWETLLECFLSAFFLFFLAEMGKAIARIEIRSRE